tara:strand:+ start:472 stop:1644 length:1173 start_codon:yes stop_codon:yes gene_type:complete
VIRAISIFFIILFFSCDNELVVNAEWEDIPVIYGILDPGYYNNSNLEENDNHYIRIQKSFLGNLAASQMAQEIDSIYYNPNDIVLSIDKLQNGVIVETFDLELVNNLDKLDGYFANESHQLYKFNSFLTDNGQPSYDFQINFYNTQTGKELSSSTSIVQPIRVRLFPTSNSQNSGVLKFGESNDPLKKIEIYDSKNVKMYKFSLRFNYVEVNTELNIRDTLFIDWNFSPKVATETQFNGQSSINLEFNINVNDFYKYLASSIDVKSNVYRYPLGVYYQGNDGGVQYTGIAFPCVDFYFEGLGLDLYNYNMSSSNPGLVENRPIYSNISNGAGLFSSVSKSNSLNIKIDNNTSDSISFGRFTKDLNFLYFRELGQGISAYDNNGNLINFSD